jgi:ketosteroid isomerase-like protein
VNIVRMLALVATIAFAPAAVAQEADHAIHEELRALLRDVVGAIGAGEYDRILPYLTENVEVTSITQEVMSGRADVSKYFVEWFGPTGYMKRMTMKLEADKLTDLAPDKSWGLVRGKALEHYEAKDGDVFDFVTRWTAVMLRGDDGRWRIRAIHFGTNNLDNPVLTKVTKTLERYAIYAGLAGLAIGVLAGWLIARRRLRRTYPTL